MSFVGSTITSLQQKYKDGLVTVFYRDFVRKKILASRPFSTNNRSVEIHVLTSTTDYLNLIWVLKSFFHYSRKNYYLVIHDDGSLLDDDKKQLLNHFPTARLIEKETADKEVLDYLSDHPRCYNFRKSNHLAPKLFDFPFYMNANKMLLLDSDVLFFANPSELIDRIENPNYIKNTVNADVSTAYTVGSTVVKEKMGIEIIERFNSGLGLVHKDSLKVELIEEFLSLPGIVGHFWRIEQTLYMLCSSKYGVELLPKEYDVYLSPQKFPAPSRHYVGAIRHLMYKEGIRYLINQNFLKEIS